MKIHRWLPIARLEKRFVAGALLACAMNVMAACAPAATIQALWDMNEVTGGTLFDSSGNARNGTIAGTVNLNLESPIPGVPSIGRSAEFTAGTSSANVGNSFGSLTNNFAVAGWIHPVALANVQRIFSGDRAGGNNGWGFGTNGTSLRFTTFGVLDYNSAAANLISRTWKHIAVNFDSANAATFYVNGVSIGTVAGANPAILSTNNFHIARAGVTGTGAPTESFGGRLDGLRVYSGTLTAGEVQSLATVPNLRDYWALDEFSGTTAGDSSGFQASGNINGTYQGGAVLGQVAAAPRFGTSVRFDGTNDEVFLGNALGSFTNDFTIAAWINPERVTGIQRILSSSVLTPGTGFGFGLDGNELRFTAFGKLDYDIAANIATNTWTHVAVTFDASNDATFFVNGVNIGTVLGTQPATATTDNFFIGRTGIIEAFQGRIDEVRFYDRVLTQGEINALIPEPSSFALFALGLFSLRWVRGKSRKNPHDLR
jgi:hypothetical protein